MKLKSIVFLALTGLFSISAIAQGCDAYFPTKKNTELTFTHFDKKNKPTGSTSNKINDIVSNAQGMEVAVSSIYTDAKGKPAAVVDYTALCKGEKLYIDMKSMMAPESMAMFKNTKIDIEGDYLELPNTLTAGQTLPDAKMSVTFSGDSPIKMKFDLDIKDRKVDGKEKVTTDAGTFDCYKISFTSVVKTIMTIETKSVSWYAKGIGMVKQESYDRNGVLSNSMVLTQFKQ